MQEIALGELNLSIDEFANATVGELTALVDGYKRRQEAMEDLFIIYGALPVYQMQLGKKAPTYKKLTAHRRRLHNVADITPEEEAYWRKVISEA